MNQRGRKKQTTNQHQGYNQQPNVPPQPYDPANPRMMPQQPCDQANPGMMAPVQQCKYFFCLPSLNVTRMS